jgi:DNA polymerase-3 subunit delta'
MLEKTIGKLDEEGFQQNPHPDALYVTTDRAQLSVDLLRGALSGANAYRALKLRKKIVIINDAERMNPEASNAILKQLEEPGKTLAVILIVNSAEKLLPTIISRCQPVELKRATGAEIRERLSKTGFSGRELEEAALFANGRIGEAYNFSRIKEDLAFAAGLFTAVASATDDVEKIFASLDAVDVKVTEQKKKSKKGKSQEEGAEQEPKDTDSVGPRVYMLQILKLMAGMFRDLLLYRLGQNNGFEAKYGMAPGRLKAYGEKALMNILKMMETAQRDILNNANIKVLFSALFFNIRKEGLT